MRAAVVYESTFGSTRELAEAIAEGLRSRCEVRVLGVDAARESDLRDVDLLVAGAPTHAHTLSAGSFPQQAAALSDDPTQDLSLEDPEVSVGLREWLDGIDAPPALFAAFDTRSDMPRLITGAASARIGRELRRKGAVPVVPPESFRVDRYVGLKAGEADRGRAGGRRIAQDASVASSQRAAG
jgi:Flavodoxin domain